jgi:hypothetical protein
MVAHVILRSEAIHTGALDCFTLRVRNDEGGGQAA